MSDNPGNGLAQPKYTVDVYVSFLRIDNDAVAFASPELITVTTDGLTGIISLGRTKHFEFGMKAEIFESRFDDKLGHFIMKAYYIRKDEEWEEIMRYWADDLTGDPISKRATVKPPDNVQIGFSAQKGGDIEARLIDYYYYSE